MHWTNGENSTTTTNENKNIKWGSEENAADAEARGSSQAGCLTVRMRVFFCFLFLPSIYRAVFSSFLLLGFF